MHPLLQDLRFSLRTLRRNPWFTTAATLALGLGIAASTALFSLMDAVLLRPMPGIAKPSELVTFERWQAGQLLGNLGYPDYLDYAARLRSFRMLAAQADARLSFARGDRVERVGGALVSGNYFALAGVQPALGRLLIAGDVRDDGEPVAVLSFSFWQRAFGRDAGALGTRILLNGHLFTVVGVAQESFRGTAPEFQPDLWLPIMLAPVTMPRLSMGVLQNRAPGWLRILGRLEPGVSLAAAQAEVNRVAAQLAEEFPVTNHARSVALIAGLGMWSDDRAELRHLLELLLVAVGLLQLLACANVANLLLVRGAARQREMAMRLALGANGRQLTRLFLMEGALLAGLAAVLGVALAPALARLAVALPQPSYVLRQAEVQIDWRVLAFAIGFGAVSALLVASLPAWKASRTNLLTPMRDGSAGAGRAKSRVRGGLAAAQIALSLALLAAAGTAIRTMQRGLLANPIARPEEVVLCSVDLTIQGYTPETGERLYEALLDRVRSLPGVTAASLGSTVPPEEISGRLSIFHPGEEPPAEELAGREFELGLRVDDDTIGPAFFRTLGIGLLAGREFESQDRAESVPVAVVNGSLARRMWPGRDPIGQRISLGPARPPVTVVGVVRDVASRSLVGEPPLHLYLPYSQAYDGRARIVVRTARDVHVADSLRQAVAQLDPRLPLFGFQNMPEHIANALWRQRLAAGILGAFGLLALAIASIGLYGVVSHGVSLRQREIGIRMAVGASGGSVCTLIARQALAWIAAGAAIGLPLASCTTWAMQKGIPGTTPNDPLTGGITCLILGAVTLLATLVPSLRAIQVDPVRALRHE